MPSTALTPREIVRRILHYEGTRPMPVVHFGFWTDTVQVWADQGHITREQANGWGDNNEHDRAIGDMLGFDFNWLSCFSPNCHLWPCFQPELIRTLPDGSRHVRTHEGVVQLERDEAGSIHAEIEHLLVDRASWEEHYKPRLQFTPERVDNVPVLTDEGWKPFAQGGAEYLRSGRRQHHLGLHPGSMIGYLRNFAGVTGLAYIGADDEDLLDEMIQTIGDLSYACTERALASGAQFDFLHFWEDICYKNGPLVTPTMFAEKIVPQYRRITQLAARHGLDIVSVDCDGKLDALVPLWLEAGVNTMFPIEVGTWHASIEPWRAQYGRELRGVGGMDKRVLAADHAAVDREVERLRRLVDLGGYIPCPDHRLAPDAKWENVQHYCERMRAAFA